MTETIEPEVEPNGQDEYYGLPAELVREIADAIDEERFDHAIELAEPLHAADFADLLEALAPDHRIALVTVMGRRVNPEALASLEEAVRDQIVAQMPISNLAAAIAELDTDDAAYILAPLDQDTQQLVLAGVPSEEREFLTEALSYPEGTAGRLMQRDYVAVPQFWTVGHVIDFLRQAEDLPDDFYEIFIVDPRHRPVGRATLSRLVRTRRPVVVGNIMDSAPRLIPVDMEQEEIAYNFEHYDLASAGVVDPTGRLIGVITHDDVVDVIREEAEEDIMRLGGVQEGDLYLAALGTARSRFTWLLINLFTAILASLTIGLFSDTIEQVVALAILMPIVASMGGNAGTQALTVAVRAIATRELTRANAVRIVWKEVIVGGVNGVAFAVLAGLVAGLWFADPVLGVVIGAAMIVNLLVAAFSGVGIPLMLERFGVDPAIAAGVLLTTVTDVVGFFVFLWLAKIALL
ncbi:MAG: magnesium transporter [Rhodospirillaceae bacterium]|nr:magnesium transporter [Rhodospirillaceae bacterium]